MEKKGYKAAKKVVAGIVVLVLMILYLAGRKEVIYSDKEPDNKIYSKDSSDAEQVELFLYHQYGYEMYVDSKTVTGEMAGAITDLMENLNETGELADKISDEEVELNSVYASSLPVDGGTMWVETEDSIYRISPERNQICRVDTYLGEGVILDFTAECWNEIHDAWYYWPLDYWSGTYENGKLNLSHIYAAETDIKATVKSINFNPITNSIKLDLVSDENQIVEIHWESYRGDHYGTIDSREVALIAGWKSPVELYFEGLPYSAPYSYSLSIRIGNAVIDILIRVEE